MKTYFRKIFAAFCCALVLSGTLIVPLVVSAQSPGNSGYKLLLPCTGEKLKGTDERECSFDDLLKLINRFINLLLYVAVILAVISFVYAGYKLLFSGGNEAAVADAKHIFWSVVVGLVFAYGAWIIVRFVITALGVKDGYDLLR